MDMEDQHHVTHYGHEGEDQNGSYMLLRVVAATCFVEILFQLSKCS